jgi:hypothetical protein
VNKVEAERQQREQKRSSHLGKLTTPGISQESTTKKKTMKEKLDAIHKLAVRNVTASQKDQTAGTVEGNNSKTIHTTKKKAPAVKKTASKQYHQESKSR